LLYPLLARALAFGRPEVIPWTLLAILAKDTVAPFLAGWIAWLAYRRHYSIAAAMLLADLLRRAVRPEGLLLLAHALIIAFAPFDILREPLDMLRLASGLVLCMWLYAAVKKTPVGTPTGGSAWCTCSSCARNPPHIFPAFPPSNSTSRPLPSRTEERERDVRISWIGEESAGSEPEKDYSRWNCSSAIPKNTIPKPHSTAAGRAIPAKPCPRRIRFCIPCIAQ
jgi:hypothetical protein